MSNLNILIVEDEPIEALDIRNTLMKLGYGVSGIANSGEECIGMLSEKKPDMILMDIMLAGEMDGIETTRKIHEDNDIPVIYLTSHSDKQSLQRAKLTEPYGYIIKPFNMRELLTIIETSSHRYRIDRQLKQNELKYRALFEQSQDAIIICDTGGLISDANQAMVNISGYGKEEIIATDLRNYGENPHDIERVLEELSSKGIIKDIEINIKKKDASIIHCLISSTRITRIGKSENLFQVMMRDVTERKNILKELIESREQLRNYSIHLQATREEERTNIAREIHDVLGQSLTALKMDVSWISKRLEKDQSELIEKSGIIMKLIDNTIDSVRKISADLRPGILDDLGLCAAIEWYADDFSRRSDISCSLNMCKSDDIDIDGQFAIALYRIYQEAMTNILRHAGASEVNIRLEKQEDIVRLVISDNGRGISEDEIHSPKAYGLMGMRERAESLGGTIRISGKVNAGTIMTAEIPC